MQIVCGDEGGAKKRGFRFGHEERIVRFWV